MSDRKLKKWCLLIEQGRNVNLRNQSQTYGLGVCSRKRGEKAAPLKISKAEGATE